MLKTVKIKNFQVHKSLELSFDSGVNIITGASDQGKSSLLRAINWVLTNRPLGDSFKNWEADKNEEMFVELEFDDGILRRTKAPKFDGYELNGLPFEALKGSIPSEIKEFLRMEFFNFQPQHDAYQFLHLTSGEFARQINMLIGLDIIDQSIRNAKAKHTKVKQSIELTTESIAKLESDIKAFEFIDNYEIDINRLQVIITGFERKLIKKESIENSLNAIQSTQEELQELNEWLEIKPSIENLQRLIRQREEQKTNLTQLQNTISAINETKQELSELNLFCELKPKLNEISKLLKQRSEQLQNTKAVRTILKTMETITEEGQAFGDEIKQLTAQRKELLASVQICPLFGGEINETCHRS